MKAKHTYSSGPHRGHQSNSAAQLLRVGIAILFACLGGVLGAQTSTGQFNGHVTDSTGAIVPHAAIELKETQTGVVRHTVSSDKGDYDFPLLPPGVYVITVSEPGYKTTASQELELDVNQKSSNDFRLTVGQASDTITVTSQTELLQASSGELGEVVEERSVQELPLNGRNFTQLLILAPGVNPVATSGGASAGYGNGPSPALPSAPIYAPSVQGQWSRENFYFLDGIADSDAFYAGYNVPPIIDATQEFKIQSHNDGAEFGGVLGGVINVVTKSGTNSFHGALWEYLRNNDFDARNPFTDINPATGAAEPAAAFRQNQFGGTIGGPVRVPHLYNGKDKTFFFFGYEGWRYTAPAGRQYFSPTDAEISGDFSASLGGGLLYDPAQTTAIGPTYTRSLLGDGVHIPAGRIDALAQNFIKNYMDRPNLATANANAPNTLLNTSGHNNADQYTGRLDENLGKKDILWFRYSLLNGVNDTPSTQKSTNVSSGTYRNFGGGITHVITPNFILDGRVGYGGRYFVSETAPNAGLPASGFGAQEAIYGHVQFDFDQYYTGLSNQGPSGWTIRTINYAANSTYTHGRHQVRFGFEQAVPESIRGLSGGAGSDDEYDFDRSQTSNPSISGTGNALASALLGLPSGNRFQANKSDLIYYSTSGYIQDNWKLTPSFDLNLGFRYDRLSTPHLKLGIAGELDPNTGNYIYSGGRVVPSCSTTVSAPCIPASIPANLAGKIMPASNPDIGPDPSNNFGPRIGFAYKLPNDQTTVVRGGYGIVYDTLQGQVQTYSDRIGNWPSVAQISNSYNQAGAPLVTVDAILPTVSSATALPAPTPFTQYGWYFDPKMKNHYSHQYNLEVQKELSSSLVTSLAYVGSVSKRLPLTALFNVGTPGSGGSNRLYPYQVSTLMSTDRGASNYNALEVSLNKRLSSGFQVLGSYTWGKSLDNGASGFYGIENGTAGFATVQNYYDLNSAYGISNYSVTHLLSVSSLYELPFGKGKKFLNHGPAAYILGDWQANTILQVHSGAPLTITDSDNDPGNVGNNGIPFFSYDRANQIGSAHVSHPTKNAYFNTAAFSAPVNAYGNSGRAPVTGPTYDNVDFSLFKGVDLGDRAKLQFRAEFFNVFNIINYANPGTTVNSGGFGVISGIQGAPRQSQFALRINY